jgi:hypothetical protein
MCAIALKIDSRGKAGLAEQMMAATHSLVEPEALQKVAQVVETDRSIASPAQDLE